MTPALEASPQAVRGITLGAIDTERYSFWYGRTQALFDVTVSVKPRAITALIGPSGCGKSTFLRSVNRLNDVIPGTHSSGEMRLDGVDGRSQGTDGGPLRQP